MFAIDYFHEIFTSCFRSWNEAGFPESLMKNINRCGYVRPRSIQKSVIPLILDGYSVKGQAETGSGKTAVSFFFDFGVFYN